MLNLGLQFTAGKWCTQVAMNAATGKTQPAFQRARAMTATTPWRKCIYSWYGRPCTLMSLHYLGPLWSCQMAFPAAICAVHICLPVICLGVYAGSAAARFLFKLPDQSCGYALHRIRPRLLHLAIPGPVRLKSHSTQHLAVAAVAAACC